MCRHFGLDSRAASLTWISLNMTALVCQLDKLVPAISPTGLTDRNAKGLSGHARGYPLPNRESKVCLLARDRQTALGSYLFGSKILAAALWRHGPSFSRMCSGAGSAERSDGELRSNVNPRMRRSALRKHRSQLHLSEFRSLLPASAFRALLRETARGMDVEPRALAVGTLLHLPRLASYNWWITTWQVRQELEINAERASNGQQWMSKPSPTYTSTIAM
jgi:hypothetical protein